MRKYNNRSGRARERSGGKGYRVLLYVSAIFIAIWILAPFYWLVATSFMNFAEFTTGQLIPKNPTLMNYLEVTLGGQITLTGQISEAWASQFRSILPFMRNSIIVALALAGYTLLLAFHAGYAFSRYKYRGSNIVFYSLLIIRAIPVIALIIPFFMLFRILNLTDTLIGLVLAQSVLTVPFAIWIIRDYIDEIPREMEEAALIDGATRLGVLYRIVYPLARPAIAAVVIFVFLTSWGEFLFALVLTSGLTFPPVIAGYQSTLQVAFTQQAAAATLGMIPPVIIMLITQRYLVKGLAGGALKT